MTMEMYIRPAHWERVLEVEVKDYESLGHHYCCASHNILPWKIYEREGRKHSAFPNFRTDRRFVFVQCKVKALGEKDSELDPRVTLWNWRSLCSCYNWEGHNHTVTKPSSIKKKKQ